MFVVGQDLAMYSRRLSGGVWSSWQDLGGAFISAPGASASQVFGIGLDETPVGRHVPVANRRPRATES